MINARVRLFSHLRAFVEQQLCDLVTWNGVKVDQAIPSELRPGGRRNLEGKYKEIATIRFGDYELTAMSPENDPPLGWVKLDCPGGVEEGPLDQSTWDRIGIFIRSRGMRVFDNGRQRSDSSGWLPGPG